MSLGRLSLATVIPASRPGERGHRGTGALAQFLEDDAPGGHRGHGVEAPCLARAGPISDPAIEPFVSVEIRNVRLDGQFDGVLKLVTQQRHSFVVDLRDVEGDPHEAAGANLGYELVETGAQPRLTAAIQVHDEVRLPKLVVEPAECGRPVQAARDQCLDSRIERTNTWSLSLRTPCTEKKRGHQDR